MDFKGFFHKHKATLTWILVLFAFRWSFADHYRVPTGSMLPTIQLGDDILTNKMAFDFKLPFTNLVLAKTSQPTRGDVIVFKFPKDETINFVKRVIALPGETLRITNDEFFINDEKLDEKYLPEQKAHYDDMEVTVPENMYFVMGDNRMNSYDSRYWGFVPRENIKGKALNVLWNLSFENYVPRMDLLRSGRRL